MEGEGLASPSSCYALNTVTRLFDGITKQKMIYHPIIRIYFQIQTSYIVVLNDLLLQ